MNQPDLDQPRRKCGTCADSGSVICWAAAAQTEARRAVLTRTELDTQKVLQMGDEGVACTCDAGEPIVDRLKKRWGREPPRYDSDQWVRRSGERTEDLARLAVWAERYVPPQVAKRSDFGDYS